MPWIFAFFFVSGFCSLLYELIWLRLAMAEFGVTSALTAIVLSAFMAGLGGGSWIAGKLVRRTHIDFPPLRLYALAELLIGVAALTVPLEFHAGAAAIAALGGPQGFSSAGFYLASGAILALTLIPWCACMGATIPLAMFAIERDARFSERRSFSFLYLANVFGSVAGCAAPVALVELYGFHRTLRIGSILNFVIAAAAIALASRSQLATRPVSDSRPPSTAPRGALWLLFATGFVTMGMELVWIRLFTPYIGPVVYLFALILGAYLAATFLGSRIYRALDGRAFDREIQSNVLWILLAPLSLLPLAASDFGISLPPVVRVLLGVMPIAGVIGFLTPMLVDRFSKSAGSGGDPDRAGRAYAVNVLGCIAGPLASGFVTLPMLGERWSMLLFAAPWLLLSKRQTWRPAAAFAAACFAIFYFTTGYENLYEPRQVMRDNTATVIAAGTGMDRELLVNGIGMTKLAPVTKMMAHMTAAWLDQPPRDSLVICFGMGTTFRSLMTWDMRTTAIELVPSVPRLIGFFHPDSANLAASPGARVIVDDGRRFLARSPDTFDIILLDPPPPVTAAASSLLYSIEFYEAAKRRLRPKGILQQWLPYSTGRAYGDDTTRAAVAKALAQSFPHVRVYEAIDGLGWHFLASLSPLPERTPDELIAHMPPRALHDLMEWGPEETPYDQFEAVLSNERTLQSFIDRDPAAPALSDDRPVNEYYLLRTERRRARQSRSDHH
ncbi:MAG TPA: hypothetical protein VKS01_02675 [Bryobacteraceae bacterium]|nr:hypothetical protein [Bryobacteraceae bacterium]